MLSQSPPLACILKDTYALDVLKVIADIKTAEERRAARREGEEFGVSTRGLGTEARKKSPVVAKQNVT